MELLISHCHLPNARHIKKAVFFCLVSLTVIHPSRILAEDKPNLFEIPIEDIGNVEITSVSKREQKVLDVGAAVTVISSEDIRRSGLNSIPEILRMVPGLSVAQLNSSEWAVTARGFNSIFANKLLVLVDGRTVYTHLFSGTVWDTVDLRLPDVERIEVIRGAGATLWGSNAVNGIINIITKNASETKGGQLVVGGGNLRELASGRYGVALSEETNIRAFVQGRRMLGVHDSSGEEFDNDWNSFLGGFRMDGTAGKDDTYTLQANAQSADLNSETTTISLSSPQAQFIPTADYIRTENVLGKWTHRSSEFTNSSLQLYFSRDGQQYFNNIKDERTADIEFQQNSNLSPNNNVVWGSGYRFITDDTRTLMPLAVGFDPEGQNFKVASAFIQDEITIVPDLFRIIVGTKVEHNSYTGVEWQPSGRLVLTPEPGTTLWTSLSRAVRIPSRVDRTIFGPTAVIPSDGLPIVATVVGDPDFVSETVISFELGGRRKITETLLLDLALFHNHYDNLPSTNPPGVPFPASDGNYLVLPIGFSNAIQGNTYGGELTADWHPVTQWKMQAWYALYESNFKNTDQSFTGSSEQVSDPESQAMLRSIFDLPYGFELDGMLRYASALGMGVASHTRADLRVGYSVSNNLTLSLVGTNLLQKRTLEFIPPVTVHPVGVAERAIYGELRWNF